MLSELHPAYIGRARPCKAEVLAKHAPGVDVFSTFFPILRSIIDSIHAPEHVEGVGRGAEARASGTAVEGRLATQVIGPTSAYPYIAF